MAESIDMQDTTDGGLERTLAATEATAKAEKLVRRTELLAAEKGGWQWVEDLDLRISFCRGLGGQHRPHFEYYGARFKPMTRDELLALVCEEMGWK